MRRAAALLAAAAAMAMAVLPARALAVPPGPPESLVALGGVQEARDYARHRAGTVRPFDHPPVPRTKTL